MDNDSFTFNKENENLPPNPKNNADRPEGPLGPAAEKRQCGLCPIALLPPGAWSKLTRPPFRKRRPFIFWSATCAGILLLLLGIASIAGEKTNMQDSLALISISGPIMDVKPTLEWIRKISHNQQVKGALVRVDSPGGGAAASQEVYAAIKQLAAKMPVAVSMGATAASGGLMVSMAGQRIFANPSTITGSIGVRMDIPQLQGLLGKLGIAQETLVTAPYKDAASYVRPLTEEDRAYLEQVLMNMHDQFINIVAMGRHMPKNRAAELANGKIYTGQQALALGLIDELGGQQDAHAWLSRETGIPESRKLLVPEISRKRIVERLLGLSEKMENAVGQFLESPVSPQPAFHY